MGGKKHKKKAKPAGSPVVRPAAAPSGVVPIDSRRLYVFDRSHGSHLWEQGLQPPEPDPRQAAAQQNWRMDARVSPEREAGLVATSELGKDMATYGEWSQGVERHYKNSAWRVFGEAANRNNVVERGALPPHVELLHLVSIGRLLNFLNGRRGRDFEFEVGTMFPGLPTVPKGNPEDRRYQDQVWSWAESLNGMGLVRVQEMAGFLADQLGAGEPPWWAGFAHELVPYLDRGDWVALCRLLGLGHLWEGETLLVFRYPAEQIFAAGGTALRPTVVEAGVNPWHFPSPVGEKYGYTMPLEMKSPRYCRELVHTPLKGTFAAESCASLLVRLAAPVLPVYHELNQLRAKQRRRLLREIPGADLKAWLDRHPAS